MKNDTFSQMASVLESTGKYDLTSSKYVRAEVKAYAAAIDKMKDYFKTALDEIFITTANDYGLSFYEDIFSIKSSGESTENRRKKLISALSAPHSQFDYKAFAEKFEKYCSDIGFSIVENVLNVSKEFGADVLAASPVSKVLCKEVSPNLQIKLIGDGRSFDKLDEENKNWLTLDSYELMWDMFDNI